jgi:DegV family protein with EDD domain
MAVRVITDSTSCIPGSERERLGIAVVPVYIQEGDTLLAEGDIDLPAFFRRLADTSELPTSSQPSPEDFARVFRTVAADGDEALAVLISSKMSGTLASAEVAADIVRESSPGASITLVDSRSNSMQEGFAVLAAARVAAIGGSLAQCEQAARDSIRRSRFLFAPLSLEYLARGGRISGAASLLGGLLRVAPVLTAVDGASAVAAIERTHRRAMDRMARIMRADVDRYGLRHAVVQVVGDVGPATHFAEEQIAPIAGAAVPVVPIGAVVGLHVGPAVGVAYETMEPMR